MKLEFNEKYEELAIEWQYQMILLLKKSLEKYKIEKRTAKEIVGEFVFDFAMFHDQHEIRMNGKSYNPVICFDDFEGSLVSTDEGFELHDYAFGSTDEAFED